MENPDIDRPAVHIGFPFFAALFVASFFGAPFAAVSAVLLFAAVFLLFLFKQHRQRPNFVLSLIATAAAFAVFAVAMHLFVLPTERYDSGTYTVTGNVESFLTKSNGRFYYKLHVTHIDEPVQDVDFSVRLSHSEAFPAEIGDTVTCEAKFFAFEDSLGLSPRTSWLADNMVLSAYVTDYESVQVTPAEKRPFSYYVNQIRTHFHNLILENYPKTEGSVLSAMLLGLRDDMETELVSAYKKAGASHILAISGVHMAILTQFTLGFLGLLGLKRRPAALVSAVFTLLFMFVSGLSASVVRSGIMQLILLFGILLGRQAEPLNSLAVAVLTMSLLNPFCAGDVSLLFSFSATLGIILLAPRITKAVTKNIRKPQRKAHLAKLVSAFSVSLSAVLFTAPLQLYLYGTVQFVSVLTSLLALEISAWLLRFGLIAALLLAVPVLSPCAAPFVFLSGICVKAQNFIITLIAEHIPGTLRISGKYLPVTVVICILFFTLSMLLYRRKNKALPCVLAVCILLCGMGANALLNQSAARLVVFRTDYAACTAIITNTSAAVLGCSGNAASVETTLRANGAEQITLLLVQPDEKSIRCAEKLAQLFEVKQILVPDTVYYPAENAAFYDFSYVGVLPSGSFTVTDGGETVTVTVNGTEIYLETKRSTSLSHDTDILVTEKPQSAVSAPFTILKTNGIIEDTEASLSPGAYLFMTEHESIRLDFDERGTYTVYGG